MLLFDKVSFSYVKDKQKECLKDINLDIKSGETVGITNDVDTLEQMISLCCDFYSFNNINN